MLSGYKHDWFSLNVTSSDSGIEEKFTFVGVSHIADNRLTFVKIALIFYSFSPDVIKSGL